MVLDNAIINKLYKRYAEARLISECYVNVTGISDDVPNPTFDMTYDFKKNPKLLRVTGFCVTATNAKDICIAIEIIFGRTLTATNIMNQIKYYESEGKYVTVLDPSYDPVSKRCIRYEGSKTGVESAAEESGLQTPQLSSLDLLTTISNPCGLLGESDSPKSFADVVRKRAEAEKSPQEKLKSVTMTDSPSSLKEIFIATNPATTSSQKTAAVLGPRSTQLPFLSSLGLGSPASVATPSPQAASLWKVSDTPMSQVAGADPSSPQIAALIKRAEDLKTSHEKVMQQLQQVRGVASPAAGYSALSPAVSQSSIHELQQLNETIAKARMELEIQVQREKLNKSLREESMSLPKDPSTIQPTLQQSKSLSPIPFSLSEGTTPVPEQLSPVPVRAPPSPVALEAGGGSSMHPMFDINRSLVETGQRFVPRSGEPLVGRPVDVKKEISANMSMIAYKRTPVLVQTFPLTDQWIVQVDKYIIGDNITDMLSSDTIQLLKRPVYSHTYKRIGTGKGSESEGSSSGDSPEEEAEEEEEPRLGDVPRMRRQAPALRPPAKRRSKRKTKAKSVSRRKTIKEAESVVMGIENVEMSLDQYMAEWMQGKDVESFISSYKLLKKREGMSDSQHLVSLLDSIQDVSGAKEQVSAMPRQT